MGNILDYIKWRGDLEFDKDEFNSIDALILSQFSYLNLEDIVPESFSKKIKLKEALNIFLDLSYQKKRLEKMCIRDSLRTISISKVLPL